MKTTAYANPLQGILLKVLSVLIFVCMSTLIKLAGAEIPIGQVTFFRSAFAIFPILAFLALRGQLVTAFRTDNVPGHIGRGFIGILAMSLGFYGLRYLPLPEAIAIGYAMPLITVVFAAVFLKETVRLYRWSAVMVGLTGVLIIVWPRLTLFDEGAMDAAAAFGAVAVLLSATFGAVAMMLVRKLIQTEKTHTIVLYFSVSASVFSLATVPFGWAPLSAYSALLLIAAGFCGGVAQILLTECYRHADVSTIAPFEYTSILLGMVFGYWLFDDVPTAVMLIGTAIVVLAGIFIIFREHRLGLERKKARKSMTPQG